MFLIEGRVFNACTDHKPLMSAMLKVSDPWTPRQQRQLSFISEITTDIKHLAGKYNYVADFLSRSCVSNVALGVDYPAMAAAQATSEDIQNPTKTWTRAPHTGSNASSQ